MQKLSKLFLATFGALFITFIFLGAGKTEFIKSDWKLEEPDKPPVSALEVEQREAKIKALQAKKLQDQQEIEQQKEEIASKRKELVQCMKDRGVMLFSVEDCAACKEQKAYFGDDFINIKYVDCNKDKFSCPLRGISKYPTWYLGSHLGIKKTGAKDLPTLARLTGCPW
jgi:hypothetical protein